MKALSILFSLSLVTGCFADINEELVSLLNARHVAALAPAKEGRIDEVDPWDGARTFGMHFDLDKAFSLAEGSFEEALTSSKITDWTFGMAAPWTPGKQRSWVAMDYAGAPFLAIRLISDQSDLVVISQVIGFADGVATLGRTRQYFFRCEITSESFVRFLKDAEKTRSTNKFVPRPDGKVTDDPFKTPEKQPAESGSQGILTPAPHTTDRTDPHN